jgi:hypothetical protein
MNNITELNYDELISIQGGGFWEDLGSAAGNLAGMIYSSVVNVTDAVCWAKMQTASMHPGAGPG